MGIDPGSCTEMGTNVERHAWFSLEIHLKLTNLKG